MYKTTIQNTREADIKKADLYIVWKATGSSFETVKHIPIVLKH